MMNDPIVIWPPGTFYAEYPDIEGYSCEDATAQHGGYWVECSEWFPPPAGASITCCPVW